MSHSILVQHLRQKWIMKHSLSGYLPCSIWYYSFWFLPCQQFIDPFTLGWGEVSQPLSLVGLVPKILRKWSIQGSGWSNLSSTWLKRKEEMRSAKVGSDFLWVLTSSIMNFIHQIKKIQHLTRRKFYPNSNPGQVWLGAALLGFSDFKTKNVICSKLGLLQMDSLWGRTKN